MMIGRSSLTGEVSVSRLHRKASLSATN